MFHHDLYHCSDGYLLRILGYTEHDESRNYARDREHIAVFQRSINASLTILMERNGNFEGTWKIWSLSSSSSNRGLKPQG